MSHKVPVPGTRYTRYSVYSWPVVQVSTGTVYSVPGPGNGRGVCIRMYRYLSLVVHTYTPYYTTGTGIFHIGIPITLVPGIVHM